MIRLKYRSYLLDPLSLMLIRVLLDEHPMYISVHIESLSRTTLAAEEFLAKTREVAYIDEKLNLLMRQIQTLRKRGSEGRR